MQNESLRIVFFGTPDFAVPCLDALIANKEEVIGVVTRPDRPKGRGRRLAPPPVRKKAESAGLPVLQPELIKGSRFLNEMKVLRPDLFVVAAYGKILPKPLLDLPRFGTINVHPSLLPKYRGAAPIQWALIRGETETGVTIMQMDEGEDTGDMLLSEKIMLATAESDSGTTEIVETAGTLSAKLAALGARLLVKAIILLREGRLHPVKQDERLATHAPLLTKKDGEIDWARPAHDIGCLIRGLDPWPSAHTAYAGKSLTLFTPSVVYRQVTEPPGTLCRADAHGLLIATGKNYLVIKEIQREGGKRMAVDSFLRGFPMEPGQRFGSY